MSRVRRFRISSCSCWTCELSVSCSAEYISPVACRFASHCFLRCRHFSAATLKERLAGTQTSGSSSHVPVSLEEVSPLFFICHLLADVIPLFLIFLVLAVVVIVV